MPETRDGPAAVVGRRALRLVLFGRPGSGKTSLLGALGLAAQQRSDNPAWSLHDLSQQLKVLQDRVVHDQPQPTITPEQVVPYPVRFEQNGRQQEAWLIDCDSNAAVQLLDAEDPLSNGPLAQALATADAVVLTIPALPETDASTFAHFERLFRLLETERGTAVRPSGLPVVPALTKCDLLARPSDTLADWVDRVQQQRQALDQWFLQLRGQTSPAFGLVQLQPAIATALRRPAGLGPPAEADRPYGVVDLFQLGLERARSYRRFEKRSSRRLVLTLFGVFAILCGLIAFGALQGRLRTQADRAALQAAVEREVNRYGKLRQRAVSLERFADFPQTGGAGIPWASWYQRGDDLRADAELPQPPPEQKLPDADTATYESVFIDETVRQARIEWQTADESLKQRRDLIAALGLVPRLDRPALLRIPPPPEFTVEQAAARLDQLTKTYPDFEVWSLDGLPRPVAQEITAVLQVSEKNLLAAGQQALLQQLQRLSPDGRETPALWVQLRRWLEKPTELAAWRDLTHAVMAISDPRATDPVTALRQFLDRAVYPIELQRLVLKVPDALRVAPAGKLTIYHGTAGEVRTALPFRQQGEPLYDPVEKSSRYTFVPEAGDAVTYRLVYRPGDTLWADLPLRSDDKQERIFTWSLCRSQVFQFERLARPPRLHRKDQAANEGELASDVTLTVPVGIVPRLPDLIPVVRLGTAKR